MKFNTNNYVRVKLTDIGRAQYEAHYRVIGCTPPDLKERSDGYTSFQLWHLMAIFGPHMFNGCKMPFESEIWIPQEDK